MITTITDRRALDDLRREWTELLLASVHPTVFLSWEWMMTWLDRADVRGTPCVLMARQPDDRLIGLAPLFLARPHGPLGLRSVRFMGTGVGADHLAFLVRAGVHTGAGVHAGAGVATDVTRALAAHLAAMREWDVLELMRMDAAGAASVADALGATAGVAHTIVEADRCPFVPLPKTWDEYLAMIGPHRRSELGRQGRRLEKQGAIQIRRAETAAQRDEIWDALLHLHQVRRDAVAGGQSAFVTASTRAFHDAFSRIALERGWLRLYLMTLDGRPVATECAYSIGGRVTDYQGGFDMALAKFGVGTVLTGHAIREAVGEGAVEFDFLRGAEQYKQQRWAAQVRVDMTVTAWRRHPRVTAMLAARRWARIARDRLRARPTHADGDAAATPGAGSSTDGA
jgi:CelD/BcsL family acetyltransferase involved in cellulose biosynthesis